MKGKTLVRVSGMILLAVAVSLAVNLRPAKPQPHADACHRQWERVGIYPIMSRALREISPVRLLFCSTLHFCKPAY
jgi:hypothetical protein